jgi:hypothetical protein
METGIETRAPSIPDLRNDFWKSPDDALLDRRTTAAGLIRSNAWMELKATTGGGPPFLKCGRRVLYRKRDVLAWLEANSLQASSTSAYPQPATKKSAIAASARESELIT